MNKQTQTEIEAASFRRLLKHLDDNKDVQNIELMNLANFCRNCLSKWYMAEAEHLGESIDYPAAQKLVYGMSIEDWKANHQKPATDEQMATFNAKQAAKEK